MKKVLNKLSILDTLVSNLHDDQHIDKILNHQYLQSKQTRKQFTNSLLNFCYENLDLEYRKRALARVYRFEDYLFKQQVPFKCSGTGFAVDPYCKAEETINKVVFAQNEKQAEEFIIDEYESTGIKVYENDLSIIELPAAISRTQLKQAI